ncbi:MAG: DUF309 domain-containing protein [Myxococcota bacterium]
MPGPIPAPVDPPPLRVAHPLPSRRYVPGVGPHPKHDPDPQWELPETADLHTLLWRGIDLLAHRYPWEAHETLERAWLGYRPTDPRRATLAMGLIKLAACWIRVHTGHKAAAALLFEASTHLLDSAGEPAIPTESLLSQTARFMGGGPWPQWPTPTDD